LKLDLKGNYRLDERHQDCPTVSRYDRRPRLNKRRICPYFTAKSLFRSRLKRGLPRVRQGRHPCCVFGSDTCSRIVYNQK
jgi:hypothetical protein